MADVEKVIKGLEEAHDIIEKHVPVRYWGYSTFACTDALALLKEREALMVEKPKPVDLEDEVRAWLDKMDAVDALANIADICVDWDGYRTADGLGGLINEIWAYARYQANRLLKEQEPASPTGDRYAHFCGKCGAVLGLYKQKYCFECGRKVKWDDA